MRLALSTARCRPLVIDILPTELVRLLRTDVSHLARDWQWSCRLTRTSALTSVVEESA